MELREGMVEPNESWECNQSTTTACAIERSVRRDRSVSNSLAKFLNN